MSPRGCVEAGLSSICVGIIRLLDEHLVLAAIDPQ
jgi:hypothetical protein